MARAALARLTASPGLALLVAAPAIAVVIVWAGLLVVTIATGVHPIWHLQPRNLAEATALRDGAAVIRRVEAGEDLNIRGEVREGLMNSEAATLTPIEAAALSGQPEMVQLLLDLGAMPDVEAWHHAFCEADDDNVRALLAPHRPAGAPDACDRR